MNNLIQNNRIMLEIERLINQASETGAIAFKDIEIIINRLVQHPDKITLLNKARARIEQAANKITEIGLPGKILSKEKDIPLIPGMIPIGITPIRRTPIFIRYPGNIAIFAKTRSFKTVFIMWLIYIFNKLSIKCWIYDLKDDYIHLKKNIPELWVITKNLLKENPLFISKNIDPIHSVNNFPNLLSYLWFMGKKMRNILHNVLHQLFTDYNTFKGGPYPTLLDVREKLIYEFPKPRFGKNRYAEAWDNLYDNIDTICNALKDQISYRKGYDMEILQNKSIIFNFQQLSYEAQDFLIHNFEYKSFLYRKIIRDKQSA